jgi:hypothetical protein
MALISGRNAPTDAEAMLHIWSAISRITGIGTATVRSQPGDGCHCSMDPQNHRRHTHAETPLARCDPMIWAPITSLRRTSSSGPYGCTKSFDHPGSPTGTDHSRRSRRLPACRLLAASISTRQSIDPVSGDRCCRRISPIPWLISHSPANISHRPASSHELARIDSDGGGGRPVKLNPAGPVRTKEPGGGNEEDNGGGNDGNPVAGPTVTPAAATGAAAVG